jgi:7-cyano-7-deazaguanine synthase
MRAVCLPSGGLDSTTLGYGAKDMGYRIFGLHFNYGQRTEEKERECAQKIAGLLPVDELLEIDLRYLSRFGGSSLTDHRIRVDDFDEERPGIPNTYVPFRNANLLSIATSFAESRGAEAIFIGVQSQDYSGYPDCRPQFIETFQKLIDIGTREETRIRLMTPFINLTKTDILKVGTTLKVPYQYTWSCYQNEDEACGTCGACHFRKKAFREIGLADPIPYREG